MMIDYMKSMNMNLVQEIKNTIINIKNQSDEFNKGADLKRNLKIIHNIMI